MRKLTKINENKLYSISQFSNVSKLGKASEILVASGRDSDLTDQIDNYVQFLFARRTCLEIFIDVLCL